MSTFEKKLDDLIAKQDHVSPNEVTLEYIRSRRESDIYPKANFNFNTKYGGYNRTRLRVLTPARIKASIESAYKFLARFNKKS